MTRVEAESGSGETGGLPSPKTLSLGDAPAITIRRLRPTARRRWPGRVVLLLALAAGAGAAAWNWEWLRGKAMAWTAGKGPGIGHIQLFTVKRGALRITLVEEGKLLAVNNQQITMQVNGKITWLAEAGSHVKKGDVLVKIDTKPFDDEKLRMAGELQAAKSELAIAEQAVPIARANGLAAVAAAKSKRDDAVLALKQYSSIEAPKKISEMESQINDTRAKLADAQKKRSDAQGQLDEMLDDGDEKKTLEAQVELQKQTVASLQKVQATQEDQRKLYRAYNYPQDLKTRQQAVDNAELDVSKAEVAAQSEGLQKEAEVRKHRENIERITGDIGRMDDQIARCTATAPVDGLIFYGTPEMARSENISERIRVGADWNAQGPIMSIPDLTAFQVAVPIAEVYRGRLKIGMPASVTMEAVPDVSLAGTLSTLATVARNRSQWDQSAPQVYDATVELRSADPRMVAGMTAKVEIVMASLADVTFVPMEAVFNEQGRTAVFVVAEEAGESHAEKRAVLTGLANDDFVEIKQGLKEGDRVLLSRPATFITPSDYQEKTDLMAAGPAATQSPAAAAPPAGK